MPSFQHIIAHFRNGSQLPIGQAGLDQYSDKGDFYIATSLLDRSRSLTYWSGLADLHGYSVQDGRSQFQYGHPLFLGHSLQDDLKNAARAVLQHYYSTTLSSKDSIHSCLKKKTPSLGHTQLFHALHVEQLFSLIQAGMVIPLVYDSILSSDSAHAIVPKVIEMQSHIGYLPRAKDMLRCMTDEKRTHVIDPIIDQTRQLGLSISKTKPILVLDNNPVNGWTSMDEIGMHRTLRNDITFPGSLYDIYRDAGELCIDIFDYDGTCTDRHLRLRDYHIVCRMLYDDIKQVELALGNTVDLGARKVMCDPKACDYIIQLLTDPEQSFLWHMAWSYLIDKSDMPVLKELTGTQHHSLDMYELYRLDRPYTIAPGHYYCKPSTGISGRGGFFVEVKQALSSTAFVAQYHKQLGPGFVSDRYILQACLNPCQLQTPVYLADCSVTSLPSICELRTIIFPGLGSLANYQPIRFARHFPLFRYHDYEITQPGIDSYCPTNMGNGLQELWQYMDHDILNPDYRLSPFGRCPVVTTYD